MTVDCEFILFPSLRRADPDAKLRGTGELIRFFIVKAVNEAFGRKKAVIELCKHCLSAGLIKRISGTFPDVALVAGLNLFGHAGLQVVGKNDKRQRYRLE